MTNRETMELFIEKNGQETVAYPFVEKDHVVFGNGMGIEEVIEQDISMPTVTHEEVSFKVGVGDQDVSSAIVDSSVAEMTIKGKTYQNILPEPSTHVLTNNKEMFKVNEGLDPNVEIVDGVSKSAILKGCTLVNNLQKISLPKTYSGTSNLDIKLSFKINADEVWYVYINAQSVISSRNYLGLLGDGSWQSKLVYYEDGLNKLKITSTSNKATHLRIAVGGGTTINSVVLIKEDVDFVNQFWGMQSVKMPVLTTSNEDGTKTNILTTPSDLELRGIGEGSNRVEDELDCLTGEVVERIGEIVLDGSEKWMLGTSKEVTQVFYIATDDTILSNVKKNSKILCDKFKVASGVDEELIVLTTSIYLGVLKSKASTVDEIKTYLAQNPLTVQYQLAQESVKTVDLSTSGNWEKVVFDGSENWTVYNRDSTRTFTKTSAFQTTIGNSVNWTFENLYVFGDNGFGGVNVYSNDKEGMFTKGKSLRLAIEKSKLLTDDVTGFKQYLSQNPLTVWYQTTAHKDSTQVKQPIFFKDGHIQLSSGADNSLIPTLDYQAKTSNSYVMDLMKTNTKYTMKAKSASGTFTIDGTSYGAGTNGTFTTPSSMTNKFLVMSDKTHEEVMIIEGDVTDKTIPYFKGIKSAFEDEDKIEVLSTGKNLFDKHTVLFSHSTDANGTVISSPQYVVSELISVKPNTVYTVKHFVVVVMYDKDKKYISQLNADYEQRTFTTPATCAYVRIRNWGLLDGVELQKQMIEKVVLQEGDTIVSYEPYKSNSTKIPLLSSLKSLPNGVCDEIILDRENNKARIIQRVGMGVLDGSAHEAWELTANDDSGVRFANDVNNMYAFPKTNGNPDGKVFTNSLLPCVFTTKTKNVPYKQAFSVWDNKIILYLEPSIANISQLRSYLSQNPITVQYELATPIITEVDLEGFPYIYKDGHIFLNSEIAPTTQIIYSISQQHQISASTQDLIRHEQELVYLYKLIAQYIQVDYQSTLLSLDLKLK